MRLACLLIVACNPVSFTPRRDLTALLNRERGYAYCTPSFDVDAENASAFKLASDLGTVHDSPFDALLVPGFTPPKQASPIALHPVARERLLRAVLDYEDGLAPFIIVSGGNVHPSGTPFNEALEMKRFLTAGGFPADRIFVEPCARHSHTNLRNGGRVLLSAGLSRLLIVTSADQAFYFSRGRLSSFISRQNQELGHTAGFLRRWDDYRVAFWPHARSFQVGEDPLDP